MTLHDMSVESAVDFHGSLEIDEVADLEVAEIGAVEGLADCGHGIGVVVMERYDGEAYAVVGHTLVDMQLRGEITCQTDMKIFPFAGKPCDAGCALYYS